MLKETLQLHEKLNKEIPFKNTTNIFLFENMLIIQTFFRKDNIPYYFKKAFSKIEIENISIDTILIKTFISNLINFYEIAKPEELDHNKLLNQVIINNH